MADLITNAEKDEIFAALRDVTDTFFKDQVTYKQESSTTNEFREKVKSSTDHVLNCRVTKEEDEAEEKREGNVDNQMIEVSFNAEYLDGLGLMSSATASAFTPEVDFLTFEGEKYKVMGEHNSDSDFMGNVVLVVITCKKDYKEA